MEIMEMGQLVVYWMHLPQGRDQCRAVLNTVVNTQVP